LTAVAFLRKNPTPSEVAIMDEMDGNLCRCGSYKRIVQAIQSAANVRKEDR
jgi:isoquinoline 1-oxidoreductase alpha subunit